MTCLTAHIFLDPEVRERRTVHLVLTMEANPLSKTLSLEHNLHHACDIHWGMTFQLLIFSLPRDVHLKCSLQCCCAGSLPPQLHTSICRYHSLSTLLISLGFPP